MSNIARLSLKKRILLAVAAIAVIRAGFYAAPRWWYGLARFYPEAYEKAISILKDEFGEAAVEAGIIRIAKEPIVVPYEGRAVMWTQAGPSALIGLFDGRCYVYTAEYLCAFHEGGLFGAREAGGIPAEKTREIWATFVYLARTEAIFDDPRQDWSCLSCGASRFSGDNRPISPEKTTSVVTSATDVVRETLRKRAIGKLRNSGEIVFASDGAHFLRAVSALIRAFLPPESDLDKSALEALMWDYKDLAPKEALALIRKIHAMRRTPGKWYYRLPELARFPWKSMVTRRQFLPGPYDNEAAILEGTEGRTDQQALEFLSKEAFPEGGWPKKTWGGSSIKYTMPKGYWRMVAARAVLARRFADKWHDLLVENYEGLDNDNKMCYLPPRELVCGDARFARLVAEDESAPNRMEAYARLYVLTQDRAVIARLREECLAGGQAREAMEWLLPLYRKDKSIGDIPAFVREIHAAPENPGPYGLTVVEALMRHIRPEDRDFMPLVRDLAAAPEAAQPRPTRERRFPYYKALAVEALGHFGDERVVDLLVECLKSAIPSGDAKLAWAAVSALRECGNERTLGVLESALKTELYYPSAAMKKLAEANEVESYKALLRRAIATAKLASAADPVARFRSLGDEKAFVEPWMLAKFLTRQQLQALLATEDTAIGRTRTLLALECNGDWQRLLYGHRVGLARL